jgi:hypothetical protein
MSQYLRFVLERAGAPVPKRVVIVPHAEAWANQQIRDEFAAIIPSAPSLLDSQAAAIPGDLVVLPFMNSFEQEGPGGVALYRRLAGMDKVWVMLYGLRWRAVSVMPAGQLHGYWKRCLRVRGLVRLFTRARLIRFIDRLLNRADYL